MPSFTAATLRLARRFALGTLAALLAQPTPTISQDAPTVGIQKDGAAVSIVIPGESGKVFTLESLEQFLNAGHEWKPIATVAPTNRPAVLFDPTCTTRPQSFYRLRLMKEAVPVEVPNFRLLDLNGEAHELFYQSDARAVVLVFAGPDPRSLESVSPALTSLAKEYRPRGVQFWVLATAAAADRARLREQSATLGTDLVVLEDEGGAVTREIGSGFVGEAVVLNPSFWSVAYRGRIADRVPRLAGPGDQALLGEALAQLIDGNPVVVRHTAPDGAALALNSFSDRTYATHIAPLLQKHCVPCHSPGNIAPWSMTNHSVVHDYAPLMKDELLSRRMPPWHADRQPQHYANDEMLSGDDLAMLVDWINRGAPKGGDQDPLAATVPPPPAEWPLGTPDQVVKIDPQAIPASGIVDYRYLVVLNPFNRDVWLKAAAVRPGNPRVVHHALIFNASSFTDILQLQAGLGGYFAAYVPGMKQVAYPAGTGKLLKKGAFLVFQMHYTATTGKPETDQTELGLYLATEPPAQELRTAAAYDTSFAIPPNTTDQPASATFTMPRDGVVYELSPHMHYRGKSFRFEAIYPDNRREVLLNVPFYRFDWQTLYRLAEPRRLPAGTRIVTTGTWDNSAKNPYNPDPSATVRFGEQSWEEMFIGYFNWSDAP